MWDVYWGCFGFVETENCIEISIFGALRELALHGGKILCPVHYTLYEIAVPLGGS
jgi:hypothetical protein